MKIVISDNGRRIESKLKDEIFKYGYSTTKGRGIGLYHAKYVCKRLIVSSSVINNMFISLSTISKRQSYDFNIKHIIRF